MYCPNSELLLLIVWIFSVALNISVTIQGSQSIDVVLLCSVTIQGSQSLALVLLCSVQTKSQLAAATAACVMHVVTRWLWDSHSLSDGGHSVYSHQRAPVVVILVTHMMMSPDWLSCGCNSLHCRSKSTINWLRYEVVTCPLQLITVDYWTTFWMIGNLFHSLVVFNYFMTGNRLLIVLMLTLTRFLKILHFNVYACKLYCAVMLIVEWWYVVMVICAIHTSGDCCQLICVCAVQAVAQHVGGLC